MSTYKQKLIHNIHQSVLFHSHILALTSYHRIDILEEIVEDYYLIGNVHNIMLNVRKFIKAVHCDYLSMCMHKTHM
jgi:hypothetical protein